MSFTRNDELGTTAPSMPGLRKKLRANSARVDRAADFLAFRIGIRCPRGLKRSAASIVAQARTLRRRRRWHCWYFGHPKCDATPGPPGWRRRLWKLSGIRGLPRESISFAQVMSQFEFLRVLCGFSSAYSAVRVF